jgi:hypothetical protein
MRMHAISLKRIRRSVSIVFVFALSSFLIKKTASVPRRREQDGVWLAVGSACLVADFEICATCLGFVLECLLADFEQKSRDVVYL